MRWFAVALLLALFGGAVATNPGPDRFETELRKAVSDKAMKKLRDGDAKEFAALAAIDLLSAGSYRSYLVFSTFEVKVLGKSLYECMGAFDRIACRKADDA